MENEEEEEEYSNKCSLYDLLAYNLLLLKLQGLFFHRNKHRRLNRVHIVYCVLLFAVKLSLSAMNIHQCVTNIGYFISITYYVNHNASIMNTTSTIDSLYRTRVLNFSLFKILFILFHIHSILYVPIFWWLSGSQRGGFHKTSVTFDLCEKAIVKNVRSFNTHRIKTRHLMWALFYAIFSVLIFIGIFLHRLILTAIYIINRNPHKFYVLCLNLSYPIIASDAMSILYFTCSQILLATYQFNSFAQYIGRLVDMRRRSRRMNQMVNIESIRQFYSKLNKHVSYMDSWLRYILGIIFLIWLPGFCLLIYCIIVYSKSSYQLFAFFIQVLAFILIQLFFLTVCGILLNSRARCFIDHLYQINLNNATKTTNDIQKMTLFISQINSRPVGVTVAGLLMIEYSSTAKIIGFIISYFLLMAELRDKIKTTTT